MARQEDFDFPVALPPELTIASIRRAIDYIGRDLADLVDLYFEQANVFSALVGMYGVKPVPANGGTD